ncbi:M16 family metallopeptidase [Candidatus Zixiibacteriota bacterium]
MAYQKTVLQNGLRVVSERVAGFRSVAVGLWVEVGSRDETKSLAGISHFLEHMVFKGTKRRTAKEIAVALESLGGSLNAFTAREQTCYLARMLDEHLPQALDVLADLLVSPRLSSRDVAKERNVICEEIHDVDDAPSDLIHDLFCENLWVGHAVGRPIMGSTKTVTKIARRDILTHLRTNYTPAKIVVVASGNVDHEKLVRLVRRHCRFSDYNGSTPPQKSPTAVPLRSAVYERDLNQAHVCIGVRAMPFIDERRHVLLVLNNLLGGGMSSRLFQSVREKHGLVYTIYSFHDYFKDTGVFGTYFGTTPQQALRATDLVLKEFKNIKRRLVPSNLLHDVKNQIRGNLVLGLESSSNRMHRLARYEMFKYQSARQTMAAIDRVTARELRDFANEIFAPDKITVSMLGPLGKETLAKLDQVKLN